MRVLWLTTDRSQRVANHFDDFRNAFCRVADTAVMYSPSFDMRPNPLYEEYRKGDRQYKPQLQDINNQYDIIVCDAFFLWMFEDWSNIDIPTAIIIEDQHGTVPPAQIQFAIEHDFIIIHRYKFDRDMPVRTIWSPHSVNIDIFKDYGQKKEYGLLQTGATHNIYETRQLVNKSLKGQSIFHQIERPKEYVADQWPVREGYSKQLNKAWMSLCCGATVQYPVMKFFEIPASGSVIYTDYFSELGDLGFIPNVNMVQINKSNILNQVEALVNEMPHRLIEIAQEGYDLIHERHTNEIRCVELCNQLKDIL